VEGTRNQSEDRKHDEGARAARSHFSARRDHSRKTPLLVAPYTASKRSRLAGAAHDLVSVVLPVAGVGKLRPN
jgi:hypothetical protein